MDVPLHSDVAWLLTLRAAERARFLALLAHELTARGRGMRFEQLRELNEIQHRVSSCIGHALGPVNGWWLRAAGAGRRCAPAALIRPFPAAAQRSRYTERLS
jgi:hypothetical protein